VFTGPTQLSKNLKDTLTQWGEDAGKNLFVGFWAQNDNKYQYVRSAFNIEKRPTIVITANSELAYIDEDEQSVYVKITDQDDLIEDKNSDETVKTLDELYLLFLDGKVEEAIKRIKIAGLLKTVKWILSKLQEI
jgi:hypothetical protein